MDRITIVGLFASCVLLAGTPARAGDWMGPFGDHLSCARFKEDNAVRGTSTVSLNTPSYIAAGCVVKRPPVLACQSATKANVTPPPPGGGPTGITHGFFCYKVKCPKSAETILGQDQFGQHVGSRSSVKFLCAPASPSGAFVDASEDVFQ
jgi:hypothetical protein